MTDETDPKILALNPGADELGFAVVAGLELRYYGARPFDGDDPNKLRGELAVFAAEEAMEHFRPDRLAVAKVTPDGSGQAMRLNVISDRIRAVAKRKGLPVDRVARAAARKAVTGDAEASREELVETLMDAFPQLQTFLTDGASEPNRDAADVFEAVGLALAAGRTIASNTG